MNKKLICTILSVLMLFTMVTSLVACTDKENQNTKEITYKIDFVSNGGSSVAAIEAKAGEKIEEPTVPVKDGFVFDGWYESSDNGVTLAKKPFAFGYMPAESITLYAKWKPKSVAGKSYKQSDTRFNWKSEEEKTLYLENSPSTEGQWISYFSSMKVEITFINDEIVTFSFYNKNELSTRNLLYAIDDDNIIRFYENEEAKIANRRYTGVGLFLHTLKIADDRSNVTIIVEMTAYAAEDPLVTVELNMICPVKGN